MLKKKAMYILALLFLLIISISSASAMGINSTDEIVGEDLVINDEYTILNDDLNENIEIDNENMGAGIEENAILTENSDSLLSDSNSITVNSNFSSIQSAVESANEGDTIFLDGYFNNDVGHRIELTKSLNFVGVNNATLDANRLSGIFNISKVSVSFNNISFLNANGSAIYSTSSSDIINFEDCIFIENFYSGLGGSGGAIYNKGKCTVKNCSFLNNSAWGNGAAIYNNEGDCSVSESIFENNSCTYGGALYACDAINCTFENNRAGQYGGAICYGTAMGCTFKNNTASLYGGAIYIRRYSQANILNCTFENDQAGSKGDFIYSDGYNNQGTGMREPLRIENSHFTNLDSNSFYLVNGSSVSFINCSFSKSDNLSDISICIINCSDVIFRDCSFEDFISNDSETSLIYVESGEHYMVHNGETLTIFSNVSFINCSGVNLAFIYNTTTFRLENSNFINCSSYDNSSSFFIMDNSSNSIFNNDSFENCSFESGGYVLYLKSFLSSNLNVSSCNFVGNVLPKDSGIFYSNRRAVFFDNCSFVNNSIGSEGILLVDGNSATSIIGCYFNFFNISNGYILNLGKYKFPSGNCYFINNSVSNGSLVLFEDEINNFCFENNFAENAYLISLSGNELNMVNCSFIGNHALNGGALYLENVSESNMINCIFDSNNASKGGAIYSSNSNLSIYDSIFTNNLAIYGSAIYLDVNSTLYLNNSTLKHNNVSNLGTVYCEKSSLSLDNCSFENNTGEGNAIYFFDDSNCTINNSYFGNIYNKGICIDEDTNINVTIINSYIRGQVFYSNLINCTFEGGIAQSCYAADCSFNDSRFKLGYAVNCSFIGGRALSYDSGSGGAMSDSTAINCTFIDNRAIFTGGAMLGGTAINCTFIANHAGDTVGMGGAIYGGEAINCTFINNSASGSGGAIHMGNAINCTFINNTANDGGAAYVRNTNLAEIVNCTFINNSAIRYGGAIYDGCNATIVDSNFINNSCNLSGGAIYLSEPEDVNIIGCTFLNCSCGENVSDSVSSNIIINVYFVNCVFDVVPEGVVCHYNSILSVDDLSFALGANGILIANLSDVRGPLVGKTVTLTVNGDDYDNLTDSNGLARFNLRDYFNSVGNYSVTLSYAGDDSINPSSANANIGIFNYKGVLSVSSSGKYYEDVNVSFRLYDATRVAPISGANIRVDFSNGYNVTLVTDSEGSASYILPFAPGTYGLTATVIDDNVDVNTVMLHDIEISRISGKIDVTQAENVLNIRLFNQNTGEVYRNVIVNLNFNVMDDFNLTTNDQGIASYDMTVLGFGTYSAIVTVPGIYTDFNAEILSSIIVKNYTVDKTNSQVSFGKAIVFDYGKTGSTTVAVVGGIIEAANITVDGHPEAVVNIVDKVIYVSGLKVGSYTLHVKTTPDEYHYSVTSTIGITVRKVAAAIKASNHAAYSKENKKWSIKLIDTRTNKTLAKMQITLKIYTGSKYKTVKLTTNSKGIATIKASTLSVGKHKVVISFSKYGHSCSNLVRYVTVKKRIKLTYTTKSDSLVDGSNLFVWVKKSNKPINKVKIRMLVYTGSKYKEYVLTTGNYKSDGNVKKGFIGYGTNMLSAGKHKIVLKPYAYMYTGSKTAYMVIKKSAKKYKQSQVFVSNGKRSMNY